MAQFAVALHNGRSVRLQILPDGIFGLAEQRLGLGPFDFVEMTFEGQRFPIEEIAAARRSVESNLIRSQDQAGKRVSGVADAGQVSPGARGIAGMDANAI